MGALKITNRFCPVHPLHKLISKKGGVWVRKRSIFYNALLLTGVNLLLRGVSMVFQVYLSRRIGAAGVGLLQLVLTVETAAITFGLSVRASPRCTSVPRNTAAAVWTGYAAR